MALQVDRRHSRVETYRNALGTWNYGVVVYLGDEAGFAADIWRSGGAGFATQDEARRVGVACRNGYVERCNAKREG